MYARTYTHTHTSTYVQSKHISYPKFVMYQSIALRSNFIPSLYVVTRLCTMIPPKNMYALLISHTEFLQNYDIQQETNSNASNYVTVSIPPFIPPSSAQKFKLLQNRFQFCAVTRRYTGHEGAHVFFCWHSTKNREVQDYLKARDTHLVEIEYANLYFKISEGKPNGTS
jgi:hypothetical protein